MPCLYVSKLLKYNCTMACFFFPKKIENLTSKYPETLECERSCK